MRQAQVTLGGQELLHQAGRWRPQHGVSLQHQLVTNGRQSVALADAWFAGRDHSDRVVEERAATQAFELFSNEGWERIELQAAEGLVGWQAGEPLQASDAMFLTLDALGAHQLV